MRFPEFDFLAFEKSLKEEMIAFRIINWATAREYVRSRCVHYDMFPMRENLWGYDIENYSMTYNNGLEVIDIWTCLENYAQEYFTYTINTCLIMSNLAIRSDVDVIDMGYFPVFNQDFFKRDPEKTKEYSAFAHIVDFDLFRVGCQMCNDKRIAGSFEFGVVVISEIGKERQNTLELREVKKSAAEANQKNDMTNAWIKVCRHNATVEGYSFIRILTDEQRPESWGADARELCSVLNIKSISERKMSLRFCFIPAFFMSVIMPKYWKYYNEVKLWGNENVYPIKNVHRVMSWIYASCERKQNVFGYYTEVIAKESGTLEEPAEEHDYYIMPKKIYAGRYSTDCYKDLFADRTLASGTSFYFINTYETACAKLDELKEQNSYFVNDLLKMYSTN